MRKKILIGSMLVLTLLLLMPSIPAIQQKSVEDSVYDDFESKVMKGIGILGDDIKFPKLRELYRNFIFLRGFRAAWLILIGMDLDIYGGVVHPLIFFRGVLLGFTSSFIDKIVFT